MEEHLWQTCMYTCHVASNWPRIADGMPFSFVHAQCFSFVVEQAHRVTKIPSLRNNNGKCHS